ncbi:MAG TPA: glycosyltransferase family 87 protein [Dictyobacter sp.]|jgi:hypothetical protein|nr:glycosyltransferase family 87 protein [Dictyobacter sp.]
MSDSQRLSHKIFHRGKISLQLLPFWFDVCVILLMAVLLYYGASWQIFEPYTDAARYQCYANAFWFGTAHLTHIMPSQCNFLLHPEQQQQLLFISQSTIIKTLQLWHVPAWIIQLVASQSSHAPFHALPYEYPWLTLIPFSLGLLVPAHWYQVAFAFWMLLIAAGLYLLLWRLRSRAHALVYALYLVVGGWATVAGRFDIIPALFTLLAIHLALKQRWRWAFFFLALATLYKFYPIVLLPSFLLVQQRDCQGRWFAWRRWMPVVTFLFTCIIVMGISLLLNVEGTLAPFSYFESRPVQAESLSASLLWLLSHIGAGSLSYVYTYGSLNVISSWGGSRILSMLVTISMIVGIVYTYWLQWRQKVDIAAASLLILLVVMVTGKVFSPQYLIWVLPLVAYIGGGKRWWIIPWVLIGLLTTWIYPHIYLMTGNIVIVPTLPMFFPSTTLRNGLLLGWLIALFVVSTINGVTAVGMSYQPHWLKKQESVDPINDEQGIARSL